MINWFKGLLAAVAATFAGTALAQSQPSTGEVLVMMPGISQTAQAMTMGDPLSPEQVLALTGGDAFRPGFYQIRAQHSGLCLLTADPRSPRIQPFLAQRPCPTPSDAPDVHTVYEFAVLPHPEGGVTIRAGGDISLLSNFDSSTMQFNPYGPPVVSPERMAMCATVARRVLLGASRIDVLPCDVPSGSPLWALAGEIDQRFALLPISGNIYFIKLWADATQTGGQCWSVAGGSRREFADVVRWECNGNADQSFELIFVRPFPAGLETDALTRSGFSQAQDGPRRTPVVRGVDLQGGTYYSFDTLNDNALYCSTRCFSELGCRAYTWKASGFDTPKPVCELKSSVPAGSYRGDSSINRVASGIVRP